MMQVVEGCGNTSASVLGFIWEACCRLPLCCVSIALFGCVVEKRVEEVWWVQWMDYIQA